MNVLGWLGPHYPTTVTNFISPFEIKVRICRVQDVSWPLRHGAWYKKKMIMLMINIDKERKFFEENGLMTLKVYETKKKKMIFLILELYIAFEFK